MAILPSIQSPADLRTLDEAQLTQLCAEIRTTIIDTVAVTGGHLGSSLGVVELTVALHRLLDSPTDRIVWDTGHQAYPHKLLTGRYERFGTLRSVGGIGGFPRRNESPHDVFDGGHAGTGLSIGEGLALARDARATNERIAVVVGDAAIFAGLSAEALNDIGHRASRLLIILNDNEMSISPSVGALSRYLSRIKLSETWRDSKRAYDRTVERIPVVGSTVLDVSRRLRGAVVDFAQHGQLFEDLGITYIGPVPGPRPPCPRRGHLAGAAPGRSGPRPRAHAEGQGLPAGRGRPGRLPRRGAAADVRAPANGTGGDGEATPSAAQAAAAARRPPNYTAVVAAELIAIAEQDPRVVAITAGMPTGTGLSQFGARFPGRMFDVGIAEQHAVTLATGLAMGGLRPFVAIYSTFLQRAFDQIVHDACQNDQPVVIGVDRAGLVGEDGTSHQGMFTLPRPAPDPEPRHRLAQGRAGGAPAAAHRLRAGPPVRPPLPARPGLRPAGRSSRRRSPSARLSCCARAMTCLSWASGPSSCVP